MRKSRVLLAGVAVAAAAAAGTSAFTGSNTMPADSVLGYGQVQATGAVITSVVYNRDPADLGLLTSIKFTTSTTITTESAKLTLRKDTGTQTVSDCDPVAGTAGAQYFTCPTTAAIKDFNIVGLAVTSV